MIFPQKLHLPPELSETASRAQEDQDTTRGKRKPLTLTTTTTAADSGLESRAGRGVHVGRRTITAEKSAAGSGGQLTQGTGGVDGSRTKVNSGTGRTGKLASHNIDF